MTVTGIGTAANPYTISSDGGALQVTDSPTVDLTLLGSGTQADPHILSAAVSISGVAGNVLTAQADGLAVTCESIQDCVGAAFGAGLTYDDAGNGFTAHVSTVAGNAVTIAGDGGLYAPTGTAVTVADTPTVDLTLAGGQITAAAIINPVAGNILTGGAGGLLVSCESVQDCVGAAFGSGLTYNDAGNLFTAHVSTDAGNSVSLGGDGGLFVPPGGAATISTADTNCIDLSGNGAGATPLTAAPIINAAAGNLLTCTATGLRAALTVGTCGLEGTGAPASPLAANVDTWAWPCADTFGTGVYCRASDGELIADPPTLTFHDQAFTNSTFANLTVPAALTNIANASVNITNPSTCRTAMMIFELEADIDFTLPAGGSAVSALNGDAITKIQNTGGSTMTQVHVQGSKTVPGADTAPGGVAVGSCDGAISNGTGGATYSRAQITVRGWAWAINP